MRAESSGGPHPHHVPSVMTVTVSLGSVRLTLVDRLLERRLQWREICKREAHRLGFGGRPLPPRGRVRKVGRTNATSIVGRFTGPPLGATPKSRVESSLCPTRRSKMPPGG